MRYGFVVKKSDGTYDQGIVTTAHSEESAREQISNVFPDSEVVKFEVDPFMWDNCLYSGNAVGHTMGFCTADSCY